MKNREPTEWRMIQRWSRLQKKAQAEKDRGKLDKIFCKMNSLAFQMQSVASSLNGNPQRDSTQLARLQTSASIN
jgi:hypothetical protein